MTFQKMPIRPKKIAVIGGGISGLGAAYVLSNRYQVTLFEAENRLGGHARTVFAGKNGNQAVDTGFIVFNYPNYPELSQLFSEFCWLCFPRLRYTTFLTAKERFKSGNRMKTKKGKTFSWIKLYENKFILVQFFHSSN